MLRKLIIALCFISGVALADWDILVSDSTNIYADGDLLAPVDAVTNGFAPSYGSLKADEDPFLVATNYAIDGATLVSGTITNTWAVDEAYLVVDGAGTWTNRFVFTNSTECPRLVTFHGRYEGLAAHTIKFQAYDYTNGVYTNFTGEADDLESSTEDSTLQLTFPSPNVNFCDTNGETLVQIVKTGVADRELYTDFIRLTFATAIATNAGVWYPLTGFAVGQSNNITVDPSAANICTTSAGDYEWRWYVSFTGETNTQFHVRHLTNGVASGTESIRTIGSTPQVGSMSAFGGGRLPSGATNSCEFKANTDNAWLSFVNGAFKVKQESN